MKLTVACVMKSQDPNHGIRYTSDWVDRLYRGITRNLDLEFDFVCVTDQILPYDTVPLTLASDGYWNKIELFRKGVFNGPTLYLDLDVVICRDITGYISRLPNDRFLLCREPYRDIHNSSVMFWNGDYSYLYDRYRDHQAEIVQEYQYNLSRPGWLGDQAYIGENVMHDLIENFAGTDFLGWRHHKIQTEISDPAVLIFTGKQKPTNNIHMTLVQENWI